MAIDLLNDLNIVGNPTLLLQNRNCETIGVIANPSGLKYKDNFNSANELSFTTYKFIDTKTYEKATKDANGKWVGYITLTSKTQKDENDQYIHGDTSDITLEIIDSSEQLELFITQKIYRTMSNADDLKDKQLTSFNLSEEAFKKDIELYSLSELESILKEFEACRNIVTTSFDKGTIDSDNGDTLKNKYYTFYFNRISMLNDEITVRQNQIDDVCKIYSIQDGVITGELAELRSTVNAALNLEKYLGTDLWKLLHCYIREDDYRNENYKSDGLETNSELIKRCQQLYDVACENLYKAGTLQYQLTTSINNLLILPEFKPAIKNFKIGNFLNVEIDNKVYLLRLLSYEINYDSLNDLSVEFSTVEKIYRGYSDVKSVLQKASSMATSFSSISSQVEESSKTSDVINDWTKNGITGDQEIKDSTDKNLVIDKNGILARSKNENSNDYDPHQLKILHSGLYTTSDNWKTTDAGIGKFTYKDINGNTIEDYGIIAKTVVGNLIIGKNLQIFSEDKSVIIDSSGLTIDGGVLKIIGKDISGEGVTISEVIIDLDTAKKLAELAKSTADTANNTANTAKDTADKAETKAQQSLDQFLWLVKSGSSSTSLTLTDSAITAITKQFTITSPDGTSTIIEGGKIKTDALKSNNYVAGNDGTYSSFGTFIDLEDGSIHTGSGGVATFKASSSMTSHKPPKEGHVLHFYWDVKNNWDSQMCISADSSPTVYVRGMTGQANTYGDWKTLLDSTNYTSYTVNKDGTGASGTWSIDITGNAATATKATSADSATKATQDENGNVISSTYLPLSGGVITGDLKVNGYLLGEAKSTGATNHAILLGHANQNYMNFYETGGLFQFYKSTGDKNTLLGKITSKGWEGNVVGNVTGNLSGNASSATKATQDGAGNVITSKYVTIDTTQTISGAKTFSKETTISSTTASTNKTTGALKVKGGIAAEGQISADKVMIGDAVTLEYNAELQCLNFVFA